MSSSKECREFADECMGWAKTARSEREQRIFLQMPKRGFVPPYWQSVANGPREGQAPPPRRRNRPIALERRMSG